MADHPFQVGVEAVIIRGKGKISSYTQLQVSKVHKTGRFILAGDDRQWTARCSSGVWMATPSRDNGMYISTYCYVLDDNMKARMNHNLARQARAARWGKMVEKIMSTHADLTTDAMLDAIEEALKLTSDKSAIG